MKKEDYYKLLKHPKWQKKRLKILERDKWTCRDCGSEEKTLHVHHKKYEYGNKPWEYKDDDLITLCEGCHEEIGKLPELKKRLTKAMNKSGLSPLGFSNLVDGFEGIFDGIKINLSSVAIWLLLSDKDFNKIILGIMDYKFKEGNKK